MAISNFIVLVVSKASCFLSYGSVRDLLGDVHAKRAAKQNSVRVVGSETNSKVSETNLTWSKRPEKTAFPDNHFPLRRKRTALVQTRFNSIAIIGNLLVDAQCLPFALVGEKCGAFQRFGRTKLASFFCVPVDVFSHYFSTKKYARLLLPWKHYQLSN